LKLRLESINKNPVTQVALEIEFLEQKKEQNQVWQYYQINFFNGKEIYQFKSQNKETISAVGTVAEIGKFAFALEPFNEIKSLSNSLEQYLKSQKQSLRFEPADPSFELIIEPLAIIGNEHNHKVYFWVDAGNTKELEYTWDSIGIRFICSNQALIDMLDQLQQN